MANNESFDKALQFIQDIGIETEFRSVKASASFLPGLMIKNGKLIIDLENLKYPGDILHEAAHIAVVSGKDRPGLSGTNIQSRKNAEAEEMMCIAWSYTACCYLEIDPSFVFHEDGYRGGSDSIIENFKSGKYFGVPDLGWLGMTTKSGEKNGKYPRIENWLRS